MSEMRHYWFRDNMDQIHVQNAVAGYLGQHAMHRNKRAFLAWAKKNSVPKSALIHAEKSDGLTCPDCAPVKA
jgi:hypothetical protein